jgi:hypothetical protein
MRLRGNEIEGRSYRPVLLQLPDSINVAFNVESNVARNVIHNVACPSLPCPKPRPLSAASPVPAGIGLADPGHPPRGHGALPDRTAYVPLGRNPYNLGQDSELSYDRSPAGRRFPPLGHQDTCLWAGIG